MSSPQFDFPKLRRRLLAWYRTHQRQLPWKDNPLPYRVWISEIMLQQTTVTAVIPYFERFLQRFPNVQHLARAEQEDVLKLWEGLGYYSRGRNLHAAARVLVEQYDGEFPQTAAELQKLPGIGRYTAGAIASFAFDRPEPIVEANTLRLYSRLLGYEQDPRSKAGQEVLWQFASDVLPKKNAGKVNQALMDIGATICTPKAPNCPACPLIEFCNAFATNRQETIPLAKAKIAITELQDIAVAIVDGSKVLLRQRQPDERWAGLWDFPRWTSMESVDLQKSAQSLSGRLSSRVVDELQARTGYSVRDVSLLHRLKHSVTRYRIELFCLTAQKASGKMMRTEPLRWFKLSELDELPLSVTARTFAQKLIESSPR